MDHSGRMSRDSSGVRDLRHSQTQLPCWISSLKLVDTSSQPLTQAGHQPAGPPLPLATALWALSPPLHRFKTHREEAPSPPSAAHPQTGSESAQPLASTCRNAQLQGDGAAAAPPPEAAAQAARGHQRGQTKRDWSELSQGPGVEGTPEFNDFFFKDCRLCQMSKLL